MADEYRQGPLVARDVELAYLRRAVDDSTRGRGSIVILEGEPGIGKTRLVEQVAAEARAEGAEVLFGAAEELERRRPFAALAACLDVNGVSTDPRRTAIARLLGGTPLGEQRFLSDVPNRTLGLFGTAAELQFRIVEAFVSLVEELAANRPVILAVDDLQWGDPSSVYVLHRLSSICPQLPLMLLVSLRPLPRSGEVDQLLHSLLAAGAHRLRLGPLPDDAVLTLTRALLGREPGPLLVKQLLGTGGNPFFVAELLAALEEHGALHEAQDGEADLGVVELLPSLALTILHRLSFLAPATLDLLRVASVLGSRVAPGELSLVTGQPLGTLLPGLREAATGGALREQGDVFTFRHDLVREALYLDLPQPVRKDLHKDAARVLATWGAPLSRLAEHVVRGAAPGDRQAVQWLREAAADAASTAPALAAELLERALELADDAHPLRDRMAAERAVSLTWAGGAAEAEELCRVVLDRRPDPAAEVTLLNALGQTLLLQGRAHEALEVVERAIASSAVTEGERVRFLAWSSVCRTLTGDLVGAGELAADVARRAADVEDPLAGCIAGAIEAAVAHYGGNFEHAATLAEQACRLADASAGRVGHRFPVHMIRGAILVYVDELEESRATLQRGLEIAEEIGIQAQLAPYHWALALVQFCAGAWDDAVAACEASEELAGERATRVGILLSHALRAHIAVHRNDLAAAEAACAAAEAEFAVTGPQYGVDWMLWGRALLLEAVGRPTEAFAVLSNAWALCEGTGLVSEYGFLGPDLVRLAVSCADGDRAAHVSRTLAAVTPRIGAAWFEAAALRSRGLLEADAKVLLEAIPALRTSGRPLPLAQGLEDAGTALAGERAGGRAAPLIEEAVRVYESLGAERDAARCRSLLRTAGLRPRTRRRTPRPVTGWEALTGTELKVARLVAQGLSNPEIARRLYVSRHTVNAHLSHILAKLGVSSRVEVATEAARRGI